jgi:ribosomal protein S27E
MLIQLTRNVRFAMAGEDQEERDCPIGLSPIRMPRLEWAASFSSNAAPLISILARAVPGQRFTQGALIGISFGPDPTWCSEIPRWHDSVQFCFLVAVMVVACKICGQVHSMPALDPGTAAECRRCGSTIARRTHHSLHLTAALSLAALILYIPANTFPILRLEMYGSVTENTVWQGAVALFGDGDYFIAVIVFLASILIPPFAFPKHPSSPLHCRSHPGSFPVSRISSGCETQVSADRYR